MKPKKYDSLGDFIRNEYAVPELKADLPVIMTKKVFGETKKAGIKHIDTWIIRFFIAICLLAALGCIFYLFTINISYIILLFVIPAFFYISTSVKEIMFFKERLRGV